MRVLLAGRTAILISQRSSTVRLAGDIDVMHLGAVVEFGSHDDLVARLGRYAKLYASQPVAYR